MHIDHRAGVLHTDHCPPSRRFPTHTNRPPVAADSAAGRKGVRSTTEGEIFKGTDGACADPDTQNFPCHGGGWSGWPGPLPVLFNRLFRHTQPSLVLSWAPRQYRPPRLLPVPPPPPLPIKKASPRLSGPASLQYEILAGKAAHYSALSTYMATNSTLSTYISTGTSLTLPRHTLITV